MKFTIKFTIKMKCTIDSSEAYGPISSWGFAELQVLTFVCLI